MAKRFTVTTALPYANGPLHLGHVAGVYIPADIYVKYLKAKGEDVVFIGGTDEHGVPISIKAKNEGVTPKEVVDRYHNIIKDSLKGLGVSLDYFGQTSSKGHYETSSEWFKKLSDDGVFREEVSQQYYDEENNQFLADRYITGDCPECKKEGAYGDQCEKCGATLNATDLINPKSALSGNKPVLKDTKHWFLPLDKFEPWLKEWIEEMKPVLKANVYGQVKSWLDSGLHQRAITRDLDWGVPVPVEGGEGKVLYVWFDAPIGYVSFTKQLLENDSNRNWEDYWKKDGDSQLVHFLGKDNIVFHSVIFPSMLKSMGDYILPQNVPANEFLNLEGEKFSTSKNWAVWLDDFLTDFPDKTDVLRYVLCSILPEQKDADFTWADFQAKNNNELVANLGNFVNRALVLTTKYWGGVVPGRNELTDLDKDVIVQLNTFPSKISASIEKHRYKEALSELMKLSALGNKYLAETEPWKLIKQDEERVKTIMNIALQITSSLAVLSVPFLPETASKLSEMMNLEGLKWGTLTEDNITEGHQINKPSLLFQRIDDEVVDAQRAKLNQAKEDAEATNKVVEPQKETTSFDEFQKMDIRVGTIIEAEKIKKAKKLLKLKVDTGIDQRTVVSGIAQFFEPEKLIGQQVSILVNLSPRKMLGIESEGMILMAENNKGELQFVAPQGGSDNGGVIA
ncbi:MAG: methionine--tRNA ligase [Flavobacteriales bacterium]|nr:methionine--tRNA ligase [Flavobacteriales bacterium]